MRPTRFFALALAISAQVALGQQVPISDSHALTLDQAITTARQNNPAFQQTRQLVRNSEATVRTAYGALLPNVSASAGGGYTQGGTQIVQGVQIGGNAPNSYNGSYRIGFNYNISPGAVFAPRAARASRSASQANVASSSETLRANVTNQYIQALEQAATAALDDSLVQTSQGQLDLANAKMKVGAGTILDVRTAEVALGQSQVTALQAHNQAQIEKLKLFQLMGVAPDTAVLLTTQFALAATPPASLDSLILIGLRANPDLLSRRSTEFSDQMQVHAAQSSYLPSLSLSTGIGGTSFAVAENPDLLVAGAQENALLQMGACLSRDSIRTGAGLSALGGCGTGALPQSQIDAIRSNNSPFHFNRTPFSVSAFLSVPIFNNFQREAQIEQAEVAHDNATFDVKARTLQLTADVTTAYLNLVTAEKTVQMQETNARQAQEALSFAEESYKVGTKTFLDVTTARGVYEQAAVAHVNSIYDYHKAFANLESAVGRPLR